MLVDFDQNFVNLNGSIMLDVESGQAVSSTLGRVAATALSLGVPDDKPIEKLQKYDLALRLYKGGKQEITESDAKLIEKSILVAYAPLVCGQAKEMLSVKSDS